MAKEASSQTHVYKRVVQRQTSSLSEYIHGRKSEQVQDALLQLQSLLSNQLEVSEINFERIDSSSNRLSMLSGVYKKMDDTVKAASKTFKKLSRAKNFYRNLFFIALYIYVAVIIFVILKRILPWKLLFFARNY
ncbi:hypothetical protein MDAP_001506 [Mitosporidium daphniae]